jgi:hypothetical protein
VAEDLQLTVRCPLCAEEHTYSLLVERSVTLGMLPPGLTEPAVERRFVRLFTCPVRAARFEATLALTETAVDRIKRVEVGTWP